MAFFDKLAEIFANQTSPPSTPQKFLSSLSTPSVSVAVLDKGNIEARCFSTLGDNEETRFQAASISKPTAATAVMRLVSQGKLSLDDKVLHHLPEELFNNLGNPDILRQITLRHLLTHTAGFRTSSYHGYARNMPTALDTLLDRNGGQNVAEKLTLFPGQKHAYCGGGFAMLQIILEKIFGKPIQEQVKELVFEPLGMSNSSFDTPEHDDDGNYARSWWTGNQPHNTPWYHHPEFASGGMWTTPTDLLKLIRGIQTSLDPQTPDDKRFLPQEVAKEMLTHVQGNVGISWFLSKNKRNVFGHFGGNSPCFRCYAVGFANTTGKVDEKDLAEGCGVAVMTNGLEGADVSCRVVHAVAYAKGWPYIGTLEQLQEVSIPVKDPSREVDPRWEEWVGEWSEGWRLEKRDDGLPRVGFREFNGLKLVPAAVPAEHGENGPSIDLLVDGLEVMLRLHFAEGERIIEVWTGLLFHRETLKRQ
ncbi:beta-lactamase [Colletotrichum truncatum]|uniref:Beta-lactamase n=1 Tax=Colletotrichum truncatum TaxID=5467 RepID=A0ACC3ZH20_COLTU|nr:beta-lactamase [Colletotrichum truncatum]KAF6790570.1 beta-lactamase [Colletotrichum truncatum]